MQLKNDAAEDEKLPTRCLLKLVLTGILALMLAPSVASATGITRMDYDWKSRVEEYRSRSMEHNYSFFKKLHSSVEGHTYHRPSHPVPEPSAALVFGLGLLLVRPVVSRFRK